jgi:hypothetical protein
MEEEVKRGKGRPKGSGDKKPRGGRKLTEAQVRDIRRLYDVDKLDYSEIQVRFPAVSRQNIEQIAQRKIWRSVV